MKLELGEKVTFENAKCRVVIDLVKKDVDGIDKEDQNNLPRFTNTKKRGLKGAVWALKEKWGADTTMYGAQEIFHRHGVTCHSWCSMD